MIKYLTLSVLICFTLSCKESTQTTKTNLSSVKTNNQSQKVGFVHAVYFYLVEDITDEDRKKFEQALETLSKVESIIDIQWGPPAGTPRKVVDNTYDYAFIPMFKDAAGHDAYQIHPIHRKFVDEFEHLFKEVKIYDNLCM